MLLPNIGGVEITLVSCQLTLLIEQIFLVCILVAAIQK